MFRQVLTVCLLVYMFSAKGYIEVSDTSLSLQTAQAIVTPGQLDIPYVKGDQLRGPMAEATRSARLAAIHAFVRFLLGHLPPGFAGDSTHAFDSLQAQCQTGTWFLESQRG